MTTPDSYTTVLPAPHAPKVVALDTPWMSEQDRANDLKARMNVALLPVLELLNEASRAGMEIHFSTAKGGMGHHFINTLHIVKVL